MQVKSRIRSRWHRANEKPLDSKDSPSSSLQNPVGEITILSLDAFQDDLDDDSAKKASQKNLSVRKPQREKSVSRNHDGDKKIDIEKKKG